MNRIIPAAQVRTELLDWVTKHAPELLQPRTKTQQILAIFTAYAHLADGWDPTKEDDYADLVSAVDEIVNAP